jgi:long-subunit acyl-CoA synthetase (AMP-forming)
VPALRFLAVGGARISTDLLTRASRLGLPVYQGYGLSECASVVTLNTPQANRPGSVGCALAHCEIAIGNDGEIHVRGESFLGYTGYPSAVAGAYATGDVGYVDSDGFLYITGRKKNMFITSHGRNVSPEWVESELEASDAIAQAWVYGEARPYNFAVITTAPGVEDHVVDAAVAATNARLPDYARVARWIRSREPFAVANAELTTNGRLRRDSLVTRYGHLLDRLYQENEIELS